MNEKNPDNKPEEFDEADWCRRLSLAKDGEELRALIHELSGPEVRVKQIDAEIQNAWALEEQEAQKDEEEAKKYLEAYARMMNMLDPSQFEPLLEDDFCYASQNVFEEITSKSQFMAYTAGKLKTLGSMGGKVKLWAELGYLRREFPGPCVVLAQGEKDDLIAVVLAKVENRKLLRLDLCIAPSPWGAIRSGIYPGFNGGTFAEFK